MPGNISEINNDVSADRQNVQDRRKDIHDYCLQLQGYSSLLSMIGNKPYQALNFPGNPEFMRQVTSDKNIDCQPKSS